MKNNLFLKKLAYYDGAKEIRKALLKTAEEYLTEAQVDEELQANKISDPNIISAIKNSIAKVNGNYPESAVIRAVNAYHNSSTQTSAVAKQKPQTKQQTKQWAATAEGNNISIEFGGAKISVPLNEIIKMITSMKPGEVANMQTFLSNLVQMITNSFASNSGIAISPQIAPTMALDVLSKAVPMLAANPAIVNQITQILPDLAGILSKPETAATDLSAVVRMIPGVAGIVPGIMGSMPGANNDLLTGAIGTAANMASGLLGGFLQGKK